VINIIKKAKEPKGATKMKIENANTGYIYHLYNNKHNKSYIGNNKYN
jgi:hypothetical protein